MVTACGNFGLIGADNGEVVFYNLQSGMKRKVFTVPSAGIADTRGRTITGIATDALNRVVVVATLRGGIFVRYFEPFIILLVYTAADICSKIWTAIRFPNYALGRIDDHTSGNYLHTAATR
jgi:hypothetical protein